MATTQGNEYTYEHYKKGNVLYIKTYLNGRLISTTTAKVEYDD